MNIKNRVVAGNKILSILFVSAILFTTLIGCEKDSVKQKTNAVPSEQQKEMSFTLNPEGMPQLNNERSAIVVISDIHLGMSDQYAETQKNRPSLADFLQKIRRSPNIKELVIAGDLIDEWFIPAYVDTYNGKSQREFVQSVAANNKIVIDAFNDIIKDGKIKVTYVPGNHDLLVTAENIEAIFPGINQARDVRGLGAYHPEGHPEIVIEHGHRYNFFCAPDPISNKHIAENSILPPGYFFTRIATLSVVEGHPVTQNTRPVITPNSLGKSQDLAYLYWKVWDALMTKLPIKESFEEKIINTNIDGFSKHYSMSDVIPQQNEINGVIDMTLFKGIQDSWHERQLLNKVAVLIPTREAIAHSAFAEGLDTQAATQYLNNSKSNVRIVVFGHSHEPRMIESKTHDEKPAVYLNSGTWIDKNQMPSMTFVAITPQGSSINAGLYQYSHEGSITTINTTRLEGF